MRTTSLAGTSPRALPILAALTVTATLTVTGFVACQGGGDSASAASDRPVVVVTLPPIASITRAVAGDAVRVEVLLPPGAHPDSYEATPRMARALAAADRIIRVGGAADDWLGAMADAPTLVITDGMQLYGGDGDGTGNPHVWLDPVRVRDAILPRIAAVLVDAAPDHADAIHQRAAAYSNSLTALDAEIRERLSGVDGRRFVAAHPAWVYFAERYGLEQVGVIHESPASELGSRVLARLVEATRSAGVRAVIAEPQLGRAGVDALVDELDVRVEIADAVGGEGMEGRETYLDLMRFNARAFARALQGDT